MSTWFVTASHRPFAGNLVWAYFPQTGTRRIVLFDHERDFQAPWYTPRGEQIRIKPSHWMPIVMPELPEAA